MNYSYVYINSVAFMFLGRFCLTFLRVNPRFQRFGISVFRRRISSGFALSAAPQDTMLPSAASRHSATGEFLTFTPGQSSMCRRRKCSLLHLGVEKSLSYVGVEKEFSTPRRKHCGIENHIVQFFLTQPYLRNLSTSSRNLETRSALRAGAEEKTAEDNDVFRFSFLCVYIHRFFCYDCIR